MQNEVMKELHKTITEGAHGGYFKTYNRISSIHYWPREIKIFVNTCDICQKFKPRKHGPVRLLNPIPIPSQPFEVVSMDFIVNLPESEGRNSILVIVDKLMKYAMFIPMVTTIGEVGTAELFSKHMVSKFRMPHQIISDRDARWKGNFWEEIC
jgi:hypothetical protein